MTTEVNQDKPLEAQETQPEPSEQVEAPEPVVEEQVEPEKPKVKMEDTPQFQLAVEREAIKRGQSMKDREIAPIKERADSIDSENRQLKDFLNIRNTAEAEAWGDEPPVRTLHDAERTLRASRAQLDEDKRKYNDGLEENNKTIEGNDAWRHAIETVFSANPEFGTKFEALQQEFLECKDSEKAIGLLKQMRTGDFKVGEPSDIQAKETKPAPTKPDSSIPGGPGPRKALEIVTAYSEGDPSISREAYEKAVKEI